MNLIRLKQLYKKKQSRFITFIYPSINSTCFFLFFNLGSELNWFCIGLAFISTLTLNRTYN